MYLALSSPFQNRHTGGTVTYLAKVTELLSSSQDVHPGSLAQKAMDLAPAAWEKASICVYVSQIL